MTAVNLVGEKYYRCKPLTPSLGSGIMPSIPKKWEDMGMNKVHQIYDIYFVEDNTFVEDEERLYRAFGLADKVRRRNFGLDDGADDLCRRIDGGRRRSTSAY